MFRLDASVGAPYAARAMSSSFSPDSPASSSVSSAPPASAVSPLLAHRSPILLAAEWRGLPALPGDAAATQAVATSLALVATLVQRHQGQIVQCTGQNLLAAFGLESAEAGADDLEHAVTCAVALQMAFRGWQLQPQAAHGPAMYLGIGLCAGPVLAGPLSGVAGPWAVLGDSVRRAEQLRAFSLRGQVLIEESLYQRCWGLVSVTAPMVVALAPGEIPLTLRELVAVPSRKLKVPRQEFRRSHRMQLDVACTCQPVLNGVALSAPFQAWLHNLGYNGVQLAWSLDDSQTAPFAPPALHSELRLSFSLPWESEPAHGIATRVVTLLPGGAGLEFIAPPPAFEAQVRRCVQQHLALR